MSKINVVLDCDPGIDDSLALILALLSDKLNLVGVSICGGNNTVENGYKNANRILKLLNKKVPLVKGYERPFFRKLEIAEETHGYDGFGEYSSDFDKNFDVSFDECSNLSLENFYSNLFDRYDDLCIVALGPLTNIYGLLKTMPENFKKLNRFISMGGNYKTFGNCSPLAEYNYWVDPEAASYVYNNLPLLVEMVGLDVTRKILLNDNRMEEIIGANRYIGDFIKKITKFYYDFHLEYEGINGCIINDPLAVACLLNDNLLKGFESYTDIACDGIARGISVVDDHNFYKKKANSIIYTDVDVEGFFEIFNDTIRGHYE